MSLTSNTNMTPAELLQLNLNDSTLDLLNAAIASHQVKSENTEEQINSNTSTETTPKKKSTAVGKLILFSICRLFIYTFLICNR
jgi:hypothetical protein